VKNRIVLPPYRTRFAATDGFVSEKHIHYYRARALGGAGLVEVEASYIDEKASATRGEGTLAVSDDRYMLGLSELAEEIKLGGARAVVQLNHFGRQCTPGDGKIPVAPSAIPDKAIVAMIGRTYPVRELSLMEIEEIVESFGQAAKRAKASEFDGVEIHGAHGYLLNEFVSPYANRRTDAYGGDLQGRARFCLECVERVREKVGSEFPLLYRMSADDYVSGGITLDEAKSFAKMLEDQGVDCIHVSASFYESAEHQVSPTYFPRGNLVHLAEAIKEALGVPVIAVGGISDPEFAERILQEGKADLVAMARALVADPDLPNKAREGRLEDIRPCIRCATFDSCNNRDPLRWPHRCAVNFLVGREGDYEIRPALTARKIVVVGGGPAGMEAARVAALRGHDVTLYEQNAKLGGLLVGVSTQPFKEDIGRLVDHLSTQIRKLGVKIELGKEATPELLRSVNPHAVILAVGWDSSIGRPPGISKERVATAVDVLLGEVRVGDTAIVVGGGLFACELALFLSRQGKNVTIVTRKPKDQLASDAEYWSKKVLLDMLTRNGIQFLTQVRVHEVTPEGVTVIDKEFTRRSVKADIVILECRQCNAERQCLKCLKIRKDVVKPFRDVAPSVYPIGDCAEPRTIKSAIHEGFQYAYFA